MRRTRSGRVFRKTTPSSRRPPWVASSSRTWGTGPRMCVRWVKWSPTCSDHFPDVLCHPYVSSDFRLRGRGGHLRTGSHLGYSHCAATEESRSRPQGYHWYLCQEHHLHYAHSRGLFLPWHSLPVGQSNSRGMYVKSPTTLLSFCHNIKKIMLSRYIL